MSRGLTVSRMGRTNETAAKERKLMDRWAREGITDPVLLEEPTGSVLLQAPFMFGSLPGMPASIEHILRLDALVEARTKVHTKSSAKTVLSKLQQLRGRFDELA